MKFCHVTGHKGIIITYMQHLGALPSQKLGRQKRLKFGAI